MSRSLIAVDLPSNGLLLFNPLFSFSGGVLYMY